MRTGVMGVVRKIGLASIEDILTSIEGIAILVGGAALLLLEDTEEGHRRWFLCLFALP